MLHGHTGYSYREIQVFRRKSSGKTELQLWRNWAVQIVLKKIWNRVFCWTSCAILVTTPGKPWGLHCNRDSRLLLIAVMRSTAVMTCWENCSCHFCIHFWHPQQSCLYRLTRSQKRQNLPELNNKNNNKKGKEPGTWTMGSVLYF